MDRLKIELMAKQELIAKTLTLESLANGIPVMPKEAVGFYKQNCLVCFHTQGHQSGVNLTVHYGSSLNEAEITPHSFAICWSGEVTSELLKAYRDLVRATDNAACAIALLLVRELTEFTAIEQACIGTTIDYYLVSKQHHDDLIFNQAARLEVSGILRENESNTVEARLKRKLNRLKLARNLPTFIVVVEFSQPWAKMVIYE